LEILSQPLWLNSEIEIGGKPVLYQRWAKADVFFINDLLKNEGGFLCSVTYLSQFFSNLLFTAITSLNCMGIAFSKPLYSQKFEIMPYLSSYKAFLQDDGRKT
jgi:hypothetical protein